MINVDLDVFTVLHSNLILPWHSSCHSCISLVICDIATMFAFMIYAHEYILKRTGAILVSTEDCFRPHWISRKPVGWTV